MVMGVGGTRFKGLITEAAGPGCSGQWDPSWALPEEKAHRPAVYSLCRKSKVGTSLSFPQVYAGPRGLQARLGHSSWASFPESRASASSPCAPTPTPMLSSSASRGSQDSSWGWMEYLQ